MEKRDQVIALGRLGWSLSRIERETGVRRETAAGYLKSAGVGVRFPGAWGRNRPATEAAQPEPDSKPANEVTSGSAEVAGSKPANEAAEVPPRLFRGSDTIQAFENRQPCEGYRELIEPVLANGRNAKAIWQDLVDGHGFADSYQSVKRFVHKHLDSPTGQQAHAVITTSAGEEAQVD